MELENLWLCIADQEFSFLVLANSESEAKDIGIDYYTEICFEPGHFKVVKADLEDQKELKDLYVNRIITADNW